MRKIFDGKPVPEAVQFYAELCCEDDNYAPVAIRALNGLQSHFLGLIEIFDEIREPNVLSLVEREKERMVCGFSISMRRLHKDLEVIRDYSLDSLASDPWIVQRVARTEAASVSTRGKDPEDAHSVQ